MSKYTAKHYVGAKFNRIDFSNAEFLRCSFIGAKFISSTFLDVQFEFTAPECPHCGKGISLSADIETIAKRLAVEAGYGETYSDLFLDKAAQTKIADPPPAAQE